MKLLFDEVDGGYECLLPKNTKGTIYLILEAPGVINISRSPLSHDTVITDTSSTFITNPNPPIVVTAPKVYDKYAPLYTYTTRGRNTAFLFPLDSSLMDYYLRIRTSSRPVYAECDIKFGVDKNPEEEEFEPD